MHKTSEKKLREKLLLKPRFLVPIIIALAAILVVYAVVELRQAKKEILHIMSEEAGTLIRSIGVASDNATLAYSELEDQVAARLLSTARLVERLDRHGLLSQKTLAEIADQNNLYRLNLFDKKGRKILGSHPDVHQDLRALHAPQDFIGSILDGTDDELVIGFKEARHGSGQRYAVAVRRSGGGAVVTNIDAEEMLRLRKEIGVGRLLNDIAANNGVVFVVIQDTLGIIAASRNVTSMSSISHDSFLAEVLQAETTKTRLTELDGEQIFEVAAPFSIEGIATGLIRVGLKTDHIALADANNKRRLIIISLVLLVGGVLVINFIVVNQNYSILDEAYLRTKTYTGNILNNMADAVVAIDRKRKVTLFNPAAERIFGIPANQAIGRNCHELIHNDSLLEQTLTTGESLTDYETEYNISGKHAVLSFNAFCMRDKQGEIDSAVAVIRDLTERRVMENTLRRNEKLSAMGELASGVAHEVRNPLNAIGMIAQRLGKEFESKSDGEEYATLTQTINLEVHRINEIIRRFLKYARPPKLVRQETLLGELLDEIIDLVGLEAESSKVAIKKEYPADLIVVIDKDQIKQVLLNLVQNSLHAIAREGTIWLRARQMTHETIVEIEDSGGGIPAENLEKVFNLYFTTKADGTGMGLSLSHQIVTAHGGRLEVESEVNKGTTFRIYLPTNRENTIERKA